MSAIQASYYELAERVQTLTELLVEASAMLNHTQCYVHDKGACPACQLESEIKQEIGE